MKQSQAAMDLTRGRPLAQSIGAKEPDEFKRRFWNGAWLCLALGSALTALALALAAPLLQLVGTPADIFADARTYILIMFAGIPAAMLYNFASGALRAAGDSRHPFYFLAFSSVLNIFLDWLFIAPFGWGLALGYCVVMVRHYLRRREAARAAAQPSN